MFAHQPIGVGAARDVGDARVRPSGRRPIPPRGLGEKPYETLMDFCPICDEMPCPKTLYANSTLEKTLMGRALQANHFA